MEEENKEIKQDDYMGIGDKSILSVGTDLEATTLDMISQLVDEDSAIVTIYYGDIIKEEQAEKLVEKVQSEFSGCDVELQFGGQPIYYYLVSVE